MTLKSLINTHAEAVFLNNDHFAETVTHRPQGNSANDAPVAAVFEEKEPRPTDNENSHWIERVAMLTVSASLTLKTSDQWIIGEGSVEWQTMSISTEELGLITVMIQRRDNVRTFRGARR
jgi:hypothetical protein